MSPETLKHNTVDTEDLKRLARGASSLIDGSRAASSMPSRRLEPNLLIPSAPAFSPPPQQGSPTVKALGLTSEGAERSSDEVTCVTCRQPDQRARHCEATADAGPTSWKMDIKVPDVAKHFCLNELSANAFVTLKVGKDAAPFVVLKSILCIRSDYFRAMFEGGFQEERSRATNLPDIKPEYFALVLQWFYTGSILFSDGTAYIGIDRDDKAINEAVQMFLFADQYDTRALRDELFGTFARWALSESHVSDVVMTAAVPIAKALSELPAGSGLYKFCSDLLVHSWAPDNTDETTAVAEYLPADITGRLLLAGRNLRGNVKTTKAPYYMGMCQYHEHRTDVERGECMLDSNDKLARMRSDAEVQARMCS